MRKIYILMIAFAMSFISCSDEQQEKQIAPTTPKTFTVSLGVKGEILDIIQTPLTKSGENNDLYGIQVYSTMTPNNEYSYSPYAYGLFDDISNVEITLLDGYSYKFVCTMVVDGKNILYKSDNGYSYPCYSSGATTLDNFFTITTTRSFFYLNKGETSLADGDSYITYYKHPNTDRYYGEISAFQPTINSTINIEMKRTVFGVKFIATGLTEGKLKIAMDNAPELYIKSYNYTEGVQYAIDGIFTFNSVGEAFNKENYSEDINTSIYWVKADGTEVPIAVNYTLTFTRKMMHTVKINLAGTETKGGTPISITLEDGELGTGKDYTIGGNN